MARANTTRGFRKLFHRLAATALPFAARKVIWAIRIRLPIAFDLGRSSAIRIAFGSSGTNPVTAISGFASLPMLDGFLAPSIRIGDDLFKPFFHIVIVDSFPELLHHPFQRARFRFCRFQHFASAEAGIDTAPYISGDGHQTLRQIEHVA